MTPAELNVVVLTAMAMLLLGGAAGLGLSFDDAALTQTLCAVALAVILAEGAPITRLARSGLG